MFSHRTSVKRKFCSQVCYWTSPWPHAGVPKSEAWKSKNRKSRPSAKGRKPPNWNPDREEQKLKRKFYYLCLGILHRVIDARGIKKDRPKEEMLGYGSRELKDHLESLWTAGMTWDNYGKGVGKWNVDHVRPVSSFPVGSSDQEINRLSNLQPMWETDNLAKSSRWKKSSS
jgi:hypothetical protein